MQAKSGSSTDRERRVRVRSRPLAEIDETKLALAVFLMAKRLVEDRTEVQASSSPEPVPAREDIDADGREVA
jgi:hypothetical protein